MELTRPYIGIDLLERMKVLNDRLAVVAERRAELELRQSSLENRLKAWCLLLEVERETPPKEAHNAPQTE